MTPNSRHLALRDTALAALVGALPGSNFGADYGYGSDYNPSFGGAPQFGTEFGHIGDDPTPQNMAAAWNAVKQTKQRQAILEPNAGSSSKIQRYGFAVNQDITVGTPQQLGGGAALGGNPETHFRPQRITVNAPGVGFILLDTIKVANVGVLVGGTHDAFDFAPQGVGQSLDVPTISPANRINVLGAYTGTAPLPLVAAAAFKVCVSFKGPATMVA
jgi:hypothetical protein